VSVGFRKASPEPPPAEEHPLWTLAKKGHQVRCTTRMTPGGPELRIYVAGELFWSRVYRDGQGDWLGEEAEKKRGEFEALGWQR
jgi:hypothetical protein